MSEVPLYVGACDLLVVEYDPTATWGILYQDDLASEQAYRGTSLIRNSTHS